VELFDGHLYDTRANRFGTTRVDVLSHAGELRVYESPLRAWDLHPQRPAHPVARAEHDPKEIAQALRALGLRHRICA